MLEDGQVRRHNNGYLKMDSLRKYWSGCLRMNRGNGGARMAEDERFTWRWTGWLKMDR
jgi:hypothetical protein